ncbi:MAG: hypothetical protein ABI700_04570 [Chloroflexota bacterium]
MNLHQQPFTRKSDRIRAELQALNARPGDAQPHEAGEIEALHKQHLTTALERSEQEEAVEQMTIAFYGTNSNQHD